MFMKTFGLLAFFTIEQAYAMNCSLLSHQDMGREVMAQLNNNSFKCNGGEIHLTFDDGPSVTHTASILSELNKRKIKATFFVSTTNLAPGGAEINKKRQIIKDMMAQNHLIASHGHKHEAYDLRLEKNGNLLEKGFSQSEREEQIKMSVDLLNQATGGKFSKQHSLLFRFPYGRGAMPSSLELQEMENLGKIRFSSRDYAVRLKEYRDQSPALQTLAGHGFSHLGWNHDSKDSSFGAGMPEKERLKAFILENLKTMCSSEASMQVALFHDIKAMNTVAIPLIVDIGQCLGLKFVDATGMLKKKTPLSKKGVYISKTSVESAPFNTMEELLEAISKSGSVHCTED